jgi:hypothetical protein
MTKPRPEPEPPCSGCGVAPDWDEENYLYHYFHSEDCQVAARIRERLEAGYYDQNPPENEGGIKATRNRPFGHPALLPDEKTPMATGVRKFRGLGTASSLSVLGSGLDTPAYGWAGLVYVRPDSAPGPFVLSCSLGGW